MIKLSRVIFLFFVLVIMSNSLNANTNKNIMARSILTQIHEDFKKALEAVKDSVGKENYNFLSIVLKDIKEVEKLAENGNILWHDKFLNLLSPYSMANTISLLSKKTSDLDVYILADRYTNSYQLLTQLIMIEQNSLLLKKK